MDKMNEVNHWALERVEKKLDRIIELMELQIPKPPDPAIEDSLERKYYEISYQLGLPEDGREHVPFCTLPPDHITSGKFLGCGITASGAMHPDSDAAKRYGEMRQSG